MKYLLLLLLFSVQLVFAQKKDFSKLLNTYQTTKNFNGVVLLATNGKIDFLGGTGIANRQQATKIQTDTKFKIASVTKTFTAVLILQLYEQGKLDLYATIGKYLPSYAGEARDKATIYNLLTYSAGIPDCEGETGMAVYQKPLPVDEFITQYCSGQLEAEPGQQFSYNNSGYIILGRIIEEVTGKSFARNLEEKILVPSGMKNTSMLSSQNIIGGLASAYTFNDSTKTFYNEAPYFIENFFSSAAMYSTVEDLLKFDQGIFGYKIIKKESVDLMIKPNAALGDVGLGFWYTKGYDKINVPYVYRPGGILGSAANWIHILNSNQTIIVFSNTNATNLFEISQQLYQISTSH